MSYISFISLEWNGKHHKRRVDTTRLAKIADILQITFSNNVTEFWVNSLRPSDTYMRRWNGSSLVQIIIIWTNAGILLIGPLGINFSEILVGIQTFSLKKFENVVCKMVSILFRPQWVNNESTLVLIMPWYQISDKPLPEQRIYSCVVIPRSGSSLCPSDATWRYRSGSTFTQVMFWAIASTSID